MTEKWTDPQQPPTWGPPQPPASPHKQSFWRRTRVVWIVLGVFAAGGILLGTLATVGILGAASTLTTNRPNGTVATPASSPAAAQPAATDAPTVQPKPSDFELAIKTLSKECFGEAGCNITYRIEVAYGGPTLDPSTTWEVTYEVRGVEDGPQINTLEVTGDQSSVDQEEMAQTPSASTHLKAVVTDVSEQ